MIEGISSGSSDQSVPGFVECVGSQDEELLIAEAIGMAFHGFSLVVGAFKRTG
jgi:hypothetical protein